MNFDTDFFFVIFFAFVFFIAAFFLENYYVSPLATDAFIQSQPD